MAGIFDVVVVGAGIVGAACAYFLSLAGVSVLVADRGQIAGGTSGAGEGNILVSDKELGPELDLAMLSNRLWRDLAEELTDWVELEPKGGLVVATSSQGLDALHLLAAAQRLHGVDAQPVPGDDLKLYEPHISDGLVGGMSYPQDMQVQPMLAAAQLLSRARAHGAELRSGCEVQSIKRDRRGGDACVAGVQTAAGFIRCGSVVNAAGAWAPEVAQRAGVELPVMPRRGFILVTEPLPRVVVHKVYTADYITNVASGSGGLETSTVVEGTRSGTVLIGASRERVGFDPGVSFTALGRLAAGAVALFPCLGNVRVMRAYAGFRPYCPDHLPVIGPDRRLPGLFHACGHEGAGIGLAPATGKLIAEALTGGAHSLSLGPFLPSRLLPYDA